jgi:dolichol-phosphate mannosyltransferase
MRETEKEFPGAQIIVSTDRYRQGKGWAMRQSLEYATGDVICFLDGDMDIPPRMLRRLLPFIKDYDIVVGRKQIRGLLSRRILTHLSRLYIWIRFGMTIDTQTGIKIFRSYALPAWDCNSFAFDVEILARAAKKGFSIIEVPVDVDIERKMKFSSIWKCFVESWRIHA